MNLKMPLRAAIAVFVIAALFITACNRASNGPTGTGPTSTRDEKTQQKAALGGEDYTRVGNGMTATTSLVANLSGNALGYVSVKEAASSGLEYKVLKKGVGLEPILSAITPNPEKADSKRRTDLRVEAIHQGRFDQALFIVNNYPAIAKTKAIVQNVAAAIWASRDNHVRLVTTCDPSCDNLRNIRWTAPGELYYQMENRIYRFTASTEKNETIYETSGRLYFFELLPDKTLLIKEDLSPINTTTAALYHYNPVRQPILKEVGPSSETFKFFDYRPVWAEGLVRNRFVLLEKALCHHEGDALNTKRTIVTERQQIVLLDSQDGFKEYILWQNGPALSPISGSIKLQHRYTLSSTSNNSLHLRPGRNGNLLLANNFTAPNTEIQYRFEPKDLRSGACRFGCGNLADWLEIDFAPEATGSETLLPNVIANRHFLDWNLLPVGSEFDFSNLIARPDDKKKKEKTAPSEETSAEERDSNKKPKRNFQGDLERILRGEDQTIGGDEEDFYHLRSDDILPIVKRIYDALMRWNEQQKHTAGKDSAQRPPEPNPAFYGALHETNNGHLAYVRLGRSRHCEAIRRRLDGQNQFEDIPLNADVFKNRVVHLLDIDREGRIYVYVTDTNDKRYKIIAIDRNNAIETIYNDSGQVKLIDLFRDYSTNPLRESQNQKKDSNDNP